MKNIRHEMHYFDNPNYPLIFHKDTLIKNTSLILPHWHTNPEILCVISGKINLVINDLKYTASQGEIVIINSNEIHEIEPITSEATYYCLILDHKFCDNLGFNVLNTKMRTINKDDEMRNIFNLIYNETKLLKPYYEIAIRALCNTMLVLMFRNQIVVVVDKTKPSDDKFTLVKKAMEYIHLHFQEDISLEGISTQIGISKYYLSRIFKDVAQMNLSIYLINFRCHQAYAILSNNLMSISECAEYCGFNSTTYFSKCFKEHYGFPPSQLQTMLPKLPANTIRTIEKNVEHDTDGVYYSTELTQ